MAYLTGLADKMHENLHMFDKLRKLYNLSSKHTLFFQRFGEVENCQKLIKTILFLPLIGLDLTICMISNLIKAILAFAISMLFMDMVSAKDAISLFVTSFANMIVVPSLAIITTVGSIVSLVTRGIATVCSDNSDNSDEHASYLIDEINRTLIPSGF